MKKIFISSLCIFLLLQVSAQKKQFDSLAIILVDQMTDVISDLNSCNGQTYYQPVQVEGKDKYEVAQIEQGEKK